MNPIFQPRINYIVRHAMRPVARFLPVRLHPRVNGIIKIDLGDGRQVKLDCNPTSFQCKVLFFQGVRGYEYTSVKILMHLAPRVELFLDVGANIGYYSLVAATCNAALQIESFEPLPSAYHYLNRNVRLNGLKNIRTWRVAASNEEGQTTFYASRDPNFPDVEHHLTATGGFNENLSTRTHLTEPFTVETVTLDAFKSTHLTGRRIDIVKLDTEASEHLVLEGAAGILSSDRPIFFCEVLPNQVGAQVEQIVRDHGYHIFRALGEKLQPLDRLCPSDDVHKEHVLVHPERLHLVEPFIKS